MFLSSFIAISSTKNNGFASANFTLSQRRRRQTMTTTTTTGDDDNNNNNNNNNNSGGVQFNWQQQHLLLLIDTIQRRNTKTSINTRGVLYTKTQYYENAIQVLIQGLVTISAVRYSSTSWYSILLISIIR